MNKFILGVFLFLSCALYASAQLIPDVLSEARQARLEIVKEQRAERKAQERPGKRDSRTTASAAAISDTEVGESSSFNKNARFFGTATTGIVFLDQDCVALTPELGPDDRCLQLDPALPTNQVGVFNDIGRITLQGKLADNVIYLIANHTTGVVLQNTTGSAVTAFSSYTPSITIESDALNDPAALDPGTSLPMNGSYTTTGFGSKSLQRWLAASATDIENLSYSRANTNGLSRTFWAALGLPTSVIDQIYKKPMTIKLNVTVRARRVESGTFFFSTRLLAN